jgi:3-deoxy-7-phosphoheptulonate synthase
MEPLIPPAELLQSIPLSPAAEESVIRGRAAVKSIIDGHDQRLMVAVGPCSIHNTQEALGYARKLSELSREVQDKILIVMRCYFEKPRTTTGWKGLIYDPELRGNGHTDVKKGLHNAREFLLQVCEMGLPTCAEFLDTYVPQYTGELVSLGTIGARNIESQIHKQMVSGLSMPVGLKNGTDGSVQTAIDAMIGAASSHSFPGIDPGGRACIVNTTGNPDTFIILRGGRSSTNYAKAQVDEAVSALREQGKRTGVMIDCSHGNSGKDFRRQGEVARNVLAQRLGGNTSVIGLMLESYLEEGRQKPDSLDRLLPGVSITDGCIGWKETQSLIKSFHQSLPSLTFMGSSRT